MGPFDMLRMTREMGRKTPKGFNRNSHGCNPWYEMINKKGAAQK